MWIRKCDLDDAAPERLPISSCVVSNEEFVPPPQTPEQKAYEARCLELAGQGAKKVGIDRRRFLRTSGGMAAALLALNDVYGHSYDVVPEEMVDEKAFEEKWPKDQFIFDVQTHHVDIAKKWYENTGEGRSIRNFFLLLRPQAKSMADAVELLNRAHYVKEIFGDSQTLLAIISGVPSREWDKNPLPPDQMVATRKFVNDLAGSQRVLSHGLLRPNLGIKELDEMERQVKELKIDAWKMYTGAELGEKAWFLDDEKIAYPFWERTKKLGIKNCCVHKGLPLSAFNEKGCYPADVEKAAKDWPDLNFIVYHSAYRGSLWLGAGTGEKVKDAKTDDPQEIPWTSELIRICKRNPGVKNIYFELGGTFNIMSQANPTMAMHFFGQLLQTVGPERILWGTDSIWNGSPQSQIERFRRLRISDELIDKYGYPQLTPEVKNKILGLNAARLFSIDPKAKREAIKADKLTQLQEQHRGEFEPTNTQYGWVWSGAPEAATVPVGQT